MYLFGWKSRRIILLIVNVILCKYPVNIQQYCTYQELLFGRFFMFSYFCHLSHKVTNDTFNWKEIYYVLRSVILYSYIYVFLCFCISVTFDRELQWGKCAVCPVSLRRRELAFLNRAYKRNGRRSAQMKYWEISFL